METDDKALLRASSPLAQLAPGNGAIEGEQSSASAAEPCPSYAEHPVAPGSASLMVLETEPDAAGVFTTVKPDDEVAILERYDEVQNVSQVAREFHRNRRTVYRILRDAMLPLLSASEVHTLGLRVASALWMKALFEDSYAQKINVSLIAAANSVLKAIEGLPAESAPDGNRPVTWTAELKEIVRKGTFTTNAPASLSHPGHSSARGLPLLRGAPPLLAGHGREGDAVSAEYPSAETGSDKEPATESTEAGSSYSSET